MQRQVQPSVRRSSKIQAAEATMVVGWHFRPTNFQWQLRYFIKSPALIKSKASHRLPPRFSNVPLDLKPPKHNRKNSKTKKRRREEKRRESVAFGRFGRFYKLVIDFFQARKVIEGRKIGACFRFQVKIVDFFLFLCLCFRS